MGDISGKLTLNGKCCQFISTGYFTINGRLDRDAHMSMCCEEIPARPRIDLAGKTAEECLREFLGMRSMAITDCAKSGGAHMGGCAGCANLSTADWDPKMKLTYINLNLYPSPCQCKCIYCNWDVKWYDTPEVYAGYQKAFEILNLAKEHGIISSKATWQTSAGEITIHPLKKEILSLVKGYRTNFYTNGFLYDADVAQNLRENPLSTVNVSLDSGTAETYQKVKGFDRLEQVVENLTKYRSATSRSEQLEIKYIILPGINNRDQDYAGLMEILQSMDVHSLILSSDILEKYSSPEKRELTMEAAAKLCTICKEHQIEPRVSVLNYRLDEIEEIDRRIDASLGRDFQGSRKCTRW